MNDLRKKIDDVAGEICKIVLQIKQEYYLGRGERVAICTLGSMDLLESIAGSQAMNKIAIAGRLLSENRGIDEIVKFCLSHPKLQTIILCGSEVKGHMAGQALLSLHRNGFSDGRIIGASGPYPTLTSTAEQVESFRKQVMIIDMIGVTDLQQILSLVA